MRGLRPRHHIQAGGGSVRVEAKVKRKLTLSRQQTPKHLSEMGHISTNTIYNSSSSKNGGSKNTSSISGRSSSGNSSSSSSSHRKCWLALGQTTNPQETCLRGDGHGSVAEKMATCAVLPTRKTSPRQSRQPPPVPPRYGAFHPLP